MKRAIQVVGAFMIALAVGGNNLRSAIIIWTSTSGGNSTGTPFATTRAEP